MQVKIEEAMFRQREKSIVLIDVNEGDTIIYGSQAENKAIGWGYAIFTGDILQSLGHGRR